MSDRPGDKTESQVKSEGAAATDPVAEVAAQTDQVADAAADQEQPAEVGGPQGPEPTRYGDWERKGRCIDF